MYFDEILIFLANNTFDFKLVFLFYFISVILLSLPVPYTFIIIINVYVFGWYGFLIMLLSIPVGSALTYYYVSQFYHLIKKIFFFKKINNKFFDNIYFLIIARATLPFFLVSLAMSLVNIPIKKYLFITILGTFANVLLVSIIVEEIRDTVIKYEDIVLDWKDPKFIVPLLLIFLLIFITNYVKKKFKLK
jgi:hypothetical protein